MLAIALAGGCAGDATHTANSALIDCEASQQSGLWLVPFGRITQTLVAGGPARATVFVAQGSATRGEGHPARTRPVRFRIISLQADGIAIDRNEVVTDDAGKASVSISTRPDTRPGLYQVEASLAGTCPQTFTFDVRQPLRQLRGVSPNPLDSFTGARVAIAVEASTNANARLAGEDVTFSLGAGKVDGVTLTTPEGTVRGETLTIKTATNGHAAVMLHTGFTPMPQLAVVASLQGTADVVFQVRVSPGLGAPCTTHGDCPLGYTCSHSACEAPAQLPSSGCTSDVHCQAPTICDLATGQCLEPTGKTCDPIEGTGCETEDVCVLGRCARVPGTCVDNGQCPATFRCVAGACVPQGRPDVGGCVRPDDCPENQTCVNGSCVSRDSCNVGVSAGRPPHRLQGTWQYDSTLHLRQALGGLTKGLLGLAGSLRDLLEGRFEIKGVPGFVSDLLSDFLRELMGEYIPPWAQQLIVALGNIDDVIDDMRVLSTVQKTAIGEDRYMCSEQWALIEFDYRGKKISAPPSTIPEIGQVTVNNYVANEVCGVLFVDKHGVSNTVGGLMKWAIGTALSLATCASGGSCYTSVDAALAQAVNCQAIGMQVEQLILSIWSGAPSVSGLVEVACQANVQMLTRKLNDELNGMSTKLSLLELSGTVNVPSPGHESQLTGGKWHGTLDGGNFDGEFIAHRL